MQVLRYLIEQIKLRNPGSSEAMHHALGARRTEAEVPYARWPHKLMED